MTSIHVITQPPNGICLFAMIIVLHNLVKGFNRTKVPILKFYRVTSMICLVSFIISIGIDLGDGIYYFWSGIDVFHTKYYWFVVLTNVFLAVSTISLYIFMFGRLYLTFKESEEFCLSKYEIYTFVILIVSDTVAFILYVTCLGLLYTHVTITSVYTYINIGFTILLIADFVSNVMILSLFLNKLQQLILSIDCSKEYAIVNNHETSHATLRIELSNSQTKMITVMTKNTILISIVIFLNNLFYASLIYGTRHKWNSFTDASIYFLGYSNMIKGFYGLVVTMYIYLNFSFNGKLYFRLCNKCDFCCYRAFVRITKNKIRNSPRELSTKNGSMTNVNESNHDDDDDEYSENVVSLLATV